MEGLSLGSRSEMAMLLSRKIKKGVARTKRKKLR